MTDGPVLPRSFAIEPVVGWKTAKVERVPNSDRYWFKPLVTAGHYEADDEAVCTDPRHDSRRPVPHTGGDARCGFNAYTTPELALQHGGSLWLLKVALSGTVVRHQWGYRASHQRVLQADAPKRCVCGQVAVGFTADDSTPHPTCSDHTMAAVTAQALGDRLGAPVGWRDTDERNEPSWMQDVWRCLRDGQVTGATIDITNERVDSTMFGDTARRFIPGLIPGRPTARVTLDIDLTR